VVGDAKTKVKATFSRDLTIARQIRRQAVQAKHKWEQMIDDLHTTYDHSEVWRKKNIAELPADRLSMEKVYRLRDEFAREHVVRDYGAIQNIVKNLKFFSTLGRGVRVNILEKCSFLEFPPDYTVFKQNDFGDKMYVILRGSVNIRIAKFTSVGIVESTVTSMYDG
jgi:hypothetical protein